MPREGVCDGQLLPLGRHQEQAPGTKNRIDILARVAEALGRHLILSFPEKVPATEGAHLLHRIHDLHT